MGKFLEHNRQILVVVLSAVILLGSGISLGFGISQLKAPRPNLQAQGFSQVSSQTDLSAKPAEVFPININTASDLELESLPEIGSTKAAAIVTYRKDHGKFKHVSEIQNVSGIGPKIYAQIKELITVK
jgi:competence protein ComEA